MISDKIVIDELTRSPFADFGDRLRAVRIRAPHEFVLIDRYTGAYRISDGSDDRINKGITKGKGNGLLLSFFKKFVADDKLWYSDRIPGSKTSRRQNPKIIIWKELQRLIDRPQAFRFLAPDSGSNLGPSTVGNPERGLDGVTLLRDSPIPHIIPKLYLSGALFAQNPQLGPDRWRDLEIGCIINTTEDDPASSSLLELYRDLGIRYISIPISDCMQLPPPDYLERIVQAVRELPLRSGNILVHCSAGINRSAYVAAALLWFTTPNAQSYWPDGESLIRYMRQRQQQDRGTVLLFNPAFYQDLTNRVFRK